jgi:glutamine amidotransferase PdxT
MKIGVLALQGDFAEHIKMLNLLATSFHPELTSDTRFHEYFLSLAD